MSDIVQINVNDTCNLRCKDCHWFSQEVKVVNTIQKEDIFYFIKKQKPSMVIFSGGEPTLWKDIVETINIISKVTRVCLNTNGMRPDIIEQITGPIVLRLSIHKHTDLQKLEQSVSIGKKKPFRLRYATFDYEGEKPLWIKRIRKSINQMSVKETDSRIGKTVKCTPDLIYIGSDGRSYQCEKGLRTKEERLFAGFTLTEGIPQKVSMTCVADKLCLTAGEDFEGQKGIPEQIMEFV